MPNDFEHFIISQQAVVKNHDSKALILQAADGRWLLPGGRINKGEVWHEAFKRELKEETGITDFSIIGIVDVGSWFKEAEANYIVTLVCSVPKNIEITLDVEHVAYAWVSLDELDSHTFFHPRMSERIKKALKEF